MINFECDYAEGAHPRILQRLIDTNLEQTSGYGRDAHCERARELIREAFDAPDADVHFLVGGTQTNKTVIASILRPYQGVISAETGHIACHETGAIEATGHKVLTVKGVEGKVTPEEIQYLYDKHFGMAGQEHCVEPAMVYISQSTEVGTIYSLAELEAVSAKCRSLHLPLFMDGARLGYGLAAEGNDIEPADIARLCDVFYVGGTKIGALIGEAVVITDPQLAPGFRSMIKQNGGLLAKGRLLGIQFETLMEDDLYMQLSRHAVEQAMRIRRVLERKGVKTVWQSPTNQLFPILANEQVKELTKKYLFTTNRHPEPGMTEVRICTSWATRPENVDALIADLERVL